MDFKCKQFSLNHSNSTMKVGTDSILLASVLNDYFSIELHSLTPSIDSVKKILDVGTGCGILALSMAQIFPYAQVSAIDIDKNSIEESLSNFSLSKWKERMQAKQISFEQFSLQEEQAEKTKEQTFDLIVSNPPYFTNSLLSPNERRSNARHNSSLSLEDFVLSSQRLSNQNTKIALVLPLQESQKIESLYNAIGFHLELRYNVYPKEKTEIKRVISLFSQQTHKTIEKKLVIRENNTYTAEYKTLTSAFLL